MKGWIATQPQVTMTPRRVLVQQLGENSDTPRDPVAVVVSEEGALVTLADGRVVDTTTKTPCCLNWDDNRLVEVTLYGVSTVDLPEFLSTGEWLHNTVGWKFLWARGCPRNAPEMVQRALLNLSAAQCRAVISLITANLRSPFRISLRDQAVAWMTDPRFPTPLTPNQLNAVIPRGWEVGQDEERIYRAKGVCPAPWPYPEKGLCAA